MQSILRSLTAVAFISWTFGATILFTFSPKLSAQIAGCGNPDILYVTRRGSNQITILDGCNGRLIRTFDVGNVPQSIAASSQGVFVSFGNRLGLYRSADGVRLWEIPGTVVDNSGNSRPISDLAATEIAVYTVPVGGSKLTKYKAIDGAMEWQVDVPGASRNFPRVAAIYDIVILASEARIYKFLPDGRQTGSWNGSNVLDVALSEHRATGGGTIFGSKRVTLLDGCLFTCDSRSAVDCDSCGFNAKITENLGQAGTFSATPAYVSANEAHLYCGYIESVLPSQVAKWSKTSSTSPSWTVRVPELNDIASSPLIENLGTGGLRVFISPQEAVNAGAAWRLSGQSEWLPSGFLQTGIPEGAYSVTFKAIVGWREPSSFGVKIVRGVNLAVIDAAQYSPDNRGSIQVIIEPPEVRVAGAAWSFHEDSSWNPSGHTLTEISPGDYAVYFKPVSSWGTPSPMKTRIVSGQTVSLMAEYRLLEVTRQRGDANGDQVLDISDAIEILDVLFSTGGTFDCLEAADANRDGAVDISDAITILSFLFLGTTAPEPSAPNCQ